MIGPTCVCVCVSCSSGRRSNNLVLSFYCFQGEDSVEYFLGLTPSGIVVLRNKTTVAYYYWPRIAKVYFKGRYFMLRVCDKNVRIAHTLPSIAFTSRLHAHTRQNMFPLKCNERPPGT